MRNCAVAVALLLAASVVPGAGQAADPFAFFGPSAPLTAEDRTRLARDLAVVRTVPARGQTVAVFATVPVAITADRLVAWVRDIEAFKQGPTVQQIGRFSDPPRIEDLAGLSFPDSDFEDVRACVPRDCALKITPAEMSALKKDLAATATAHRQDVLRRLLLQRVQSYLAEGLTAPAFAAMLDESGFLRQQVPNVAMAVEGRPHASNGAGNGHVETFLYWAKEHYGGKPIVSATQVYVVPLHTGSTEVLIISKQIFATHYLDAWLGVTALVRDPGSQKAYFVYVVRSSVDVVRGFWGGIVRRILQRRLKSEGVALIDGIRRRLERGMPPSMTGSPSR